VGRDCRDDFHQLLAWETEDFEGRGAVHHLTVLCFHLQHPSRYSPEGLREALRLLIEFVERGTSPAEIRRRGRSPVSSSTREWKVTARAGSQGAYPGPVAWTMTASQVAAAGPERYCDQVRAWARSVLVDLRASGNL
jgi:hypothetical protein